MQISLLRSHIFNVYKFISNNVYKDPYMSERARNENKSCTINTYSVDLDLQLLK